jgi:hypothetical protein
MDTFERDSSIDSDSGGAPEYTPMRRVNARNGLRVDASYENKQDSF